MSGRVLSEYAPFPETALAGKPADPGFVGRLRSLALSGLGRMFRPDPGLFAFRVRPGPNGLVQEGLSQRYTAIALLGLAGEEDEIAAGVLAGQWPQAVCARLLRDVNSMESVGDVALTLWAAHAVGGADSRPAWNRLLALRPDEASLPTVELAWALSALCIAGDGSTSGLRQRLAVRLLSAFHTGSSLFPHRVGDGGWHPRAHVSSFADLVYPILALSHYAKLSGDAPAREAAARCARVVCRLQGPEGQWWWHYDVRTGRVIERYPVYAVHQDAMAPLALFALQDASGGDFTREIAAGLRWLAASPELEGRSLVDPGARLIWRKVARREPRKLSRYAQALASALHPSIRVPGLGRVLPPRVVDVEDRPYHLGWLLLAWPAQRAARWHAAAP
jgi:hypothetical protein